MSTYTILRTAWGDTPKTEFVDAVLNKQSSLQTLIDSVKRGLHYARTGQLPERNEHDKSRI